MPPTSSAPTSANTGAYGEAEPSSSSLGASREPMNAPAAKPASDRKPTIRPCMYPHRAISRTKAIIPQSSAVTGAGR